MESQDRDPLSVDFEALECLSYADLKLRCRIKGCSFESSTRIDLFHPEKNPFVEKLESYFKIKIRENDPLSHAICDKCFEELQLFEGYIELCEKAQRIMWSTYLTNNISNNIIESSKKSSAMNSNLEKNKSSESRTSQKRKFESHNKTSHGQLVIQSQASNCGTKNKYYDKSSHDLQSKRQKIDTSNNKIRDNKIESVKETSEKLCGDSKNTNQVNKEAELNGLNSKSEKSTVTTELSTFIVNCESNNKDTEKPTFDDKKSTHLDSSDHTTIRNFTVKPKFPNIDLPSILIPDVLDPDSEDSFCADSSQLSRQYLKHIIDHPKYIPWPEDNKQDLSKPGKFKILQEQRRKKSLKVMEKCAVLVQDIFKPYLQQKTKDSLHTKNHEACESGPTNNENHEVGESEPIKTKDDEVRGSGHTNTENHEAGESEPTNSENPKNRDSELTHTKNHEVRESESTNTENHEVCELEPTVIENVEVCNSVAMDIEKHETCGSKSLKKSKPGPLFSKTKVRKKSNNFKSKASSENNCIKGVSQVTILTKQKSNDCYSHVTHNENLNNISSKYDPDDFDLSDLVYPKEECSSVSRKSGQKSKANRDNNSKKKRNSKKNKTDIGTETTAGTVQHKLYYVKNDIEPKEFSSETRKKIHHVQIENSLVQKESKNKNILTSNSFSIRRKAGPLSSKTKYNKNQKLTSDIKEQNASQKIHNLQITNNNETENNSSTNEKEITDEQISTDHEIPISGMSGCNDEKLDDLDDAIDSFFTEDIDSTENSNDYIDPFVLKKEPPVTNKNGETNISTRNKSICEINDSSNIISIDSQLNYGTEISRELKNLEQHIKVNRISSAENENCATRNKTIGKNSPKPHNEDSKTCRYKESTNTTSEYCPQNISSAIKMPSQGVVSKYKATPTSFLSNSEHSTRVKDSELHRTPIISGVSNNKKSFSIEQIFSNPTEISPVRRKSLPLSPNSLNSKNEFINNYSCTQCGQNFDKNIALQRHKSRKHSNFDALTSKNKMLPRKLNQSKLRADNNPPIKNHRKKNIKEEESMNIKRAREQMIQRNLEKKSQLLQQTNVTNSSSVVKDSQQRSNRQKENLGCEETEAVIKSICPSSPTSQSTINSHCQTLTKHVTSINVDSITGRTINSAIDNVATANHDGQHSLNSNKGVSTSSYIDKNNDKDLESLGKNKESNALGPILHHSSDNVLHSNRRASDKRDINKIVPNSLDIFHNDSDELEISTSKSSENNEHTNDSNLLTSDSNIERNEENELHGEQTTQTSEERDKIRNIRISKELLTKSKEILLNNSLNISKPDNLHAPNLRKLRFVKESIDSNTTHVSTSQISKSTKNVNAELNVAKLIKSDECTTWNNIHEDTTIQEIDKYNISESINKTPKILKTTEVLNITPEKKIVETTSTEIEKDKKTSTKKDLDTSMTKVEKIQNTKHVESNGNLIDALQISSTEKYKVDSNSRVDKDIEPFKESENGDGKITGEVIITGNTEELELKKSAQNTNEQNAQLTSMLPKSTGKMETINNNLTTIKATNVVLNRTVKESTSSSSEKYRKKPKLSSKLKKLNLKKKVRKNVNNTLNGNRQKDIIIDFKKAEIRPNKKNSSDRSKISKKKKKCKIIKSNLEDSPYSPNSSEIVSLNHQEENEGYAECLVKNTHQAIVTNSENMGDNLLFNKNNNCDTVESNSCTHEKLFFNKDELMKNNIGDININGEDDANNKSSTPSVEKGIDSKITQNESNKINNEKPTVISFLGYDKDVDIIDFTESAVVVNNPEEVKKIFALTPEEINAKLASGKLTSAATYDNLPSENSFHMEKSINDGIISNEYLLSEILANTEDSNLEECEANLVSTVNRNNCSTFNNFIPVSSEQYCNSPIQPPRRIPEENLSTTPEIFRVIPPKDRQNFTTSETPPPSTVLHYVPHGTTLTKVSNMQSPRSLLLESLTSDLNKSARCSVNQKSPPLRSSPICQTSLQRAPHTNFSNQKVASTSYQPQKQAPTYFNSGFSQTNIPPQSRLSQEGPQRLSIRRESYSQFSIRNVSPPRTNSFLSEKQNYQQNPFIQPSQHIMQQSQHQISQSLQNFIDRRTNSSRQQIHHVQNIPQPTHQTNSYGNYEQQNQNNLYQEELSGRSISKTPMLYLNNGHFI